MSRKIRTAIIGYGYSGKLFHAPFIHYSPLYELVKVVERNNNHSEQDYPYVTRVKTVEEVLEDDSIELVVITTPNHTHYELVNLALDHGKHVVVEKPFTITSDEAKRLIKKAEENKCLLTVYHNRRLDGDYKTVKNIIEEGLLGQVLELESHWERYKGEINTKKPWKENGLEGCDLLYDIGVHLIDQAVQLFGYPLEITADLRVQRENSQVIDYFDIFLGYKHRRIRCRSSMLIKETGPRFIVHGTKGSFIKKGTDLQEERLANKLNPYQNGFGRDNKKMFGSLNVLDDHSMIETENGSYYRFYDNLYHAIMNKEELLVKPDEAMKVIRLIELAVLSNQQKKTLKVEI